MDDVCALTNKHDEQANKALLDLTTGGCYPKPLHMTNDSNETFLETKLVQDKITGLVHFKHWNKNANLNKQEFYKGKHFHSAGPLHQKVGAIKGTFVRIDRNTSTLGLFYEALQEKCNELHNLKYPAKLLNNIMHHFLQSRQNTKKYI